MLLLTGYKRKGKDEESDNETDEDVAELDKDKDIEGLEDLSKSKTLPAEAKDVLNDLKMEISGNHWTPFLNKWKLIEKPMHWHLLRSSLT